MNSIGYDSFRSSFIQWNIKIELICMISTIPFAGLFPPSENQFPPTEIQFPLTEIQFPLSEI